MTRLVAVAASLVLTLAGCAAMTQPAITDNTAVAELRDAKGQPAGVATLTQVAGGVRIIIETRRMPPGPRGAHIHEVGKCDAPQFTTAGEHFNPGKKQHGTLNPQGAHAGDLPNMTIAADGTGRLETVTERVTLGAGANSLFGAGGSSIIVHGSPDDFKTDPTGNTGARIACGVIVKKPR